MDELSVTLLLASLLVGVLSVALFKYLKQYQELRATLNKIPGPKDTFLFGNALLFEREGHVFLKQVMDWTQKYKGFYCLWLGPRPLIFTATPEAAEFVISGTKHLSKAFVYSFVHPWLGTGLLTSTGGKWKTRRRLITPTFHFKILNNFIRVFQEQSEVLIAQLKGKEGPQPFNISLYIGRCALDIICETSMGKSVNTQENKDSEYGKAVIRMSELVQDRQKSPWLWPDFLYNYLTPSGWEHTKCLGILHGFTNKVIDDKIKERKSLPQSSKREEAVDDIYGTGRRKKKLAFLDLLMESYDEEKIDREGIREEVDTFMFEV